MRKTLNILFWFVIVTTTFVLLGFMNGKYKNTRLASIDISLNYHDDNQLITKEDVKKVLKSTFDSIGLQAVNDIDLQSIEEILAASPFIDQADVYTTMNGKLFIELVQPEVIARIIEQNGNQYYIDEHTRYIPLNANNVAKVPVVSGYISRLNFRNPGYALISTILFAKEIYNISRIMAYLDKDRFLHTQIDQIYITHDHEYELIPKIGKHYIEFGGIRNMEHKFQNLFVFYKKGISNNNWAKYRKINLKYNNQVVCTKK